MRNLTANEDRGDIGLRWQVGRDTAFVRTTRVGIAGRLLRSKAPAPPRSAGAVHDFSFRVMGISTVSLQPTEKPS